MMRTPVMTKADIVRDQLTAFCRQDWEKYRSFLTPDATYVEPATDRRLEGPDAIVEGLKLWTTAYPDIEAHFVDLVEGPDTIAVTIEWEATLTGPLMTEGGRIEPTGYHGIVPAAMFTRFEGDRVREMRHYFDMLGLLKRAGALPTP
jgi:ketosteroid isomerase-like protein